MLTGELARLQSRKDDRPFVQGLTQIENEIYNLENDPKLEALENRVDDRLYIENLADLQKQIAILSLQPDEFSNVTLAIVDQYPAVPKKSTRKTLLILIAGIIVSIIFALFVIMLLLVFKRRDDTESESEPAINIS